MKTKKIILVCFLVLILVKQIYCQNWLIYNQANSNGPPISTLAYMTIDTANYKWFANFRSGTGVWKFDNHSTWLDNSIATYQQVEDIECDLNNQIWITILGRGLYTGTGVPWHFYNDTVNNFALLAASTDIAVDSNNIKLIANYYGLIKFDGITFSLFDTANSTLPFEPVRKVITDKHHTIWIAGDSSIAVSTNNGNTWTSYNKNNCTLLAYGIKTMAIDDFGTLWFGSLNTANGLIKCNAGNFGNYTTSNSNINVDKIDIVSIDKNNKVWVGGIGGVPFSNNGIASFDGTLWTTYNTSNSLIPSNAIDNIQVDRYNNKWITCSGCVAVAVFNENGVVGVEEINNEINETGLISYPNPANNNIIIDFESTGKEKNIIEIKNVLGQTIETITKQIVNGHNKIEIDVSDFLSGIYFIQVLNGDKVLNKKFIKE